MSDTTAPVTDPKKPKEWHPQQSKLLQSWAEIASSYRWMHNQAYMIYKKKNLNFMLPLIIMSTVTGTANFAQSTFPSGIRPYVPQIIGSINLVSAIMTTIYQFLKISEFMESHRISSINYGKLARTITVELNLPVKDRNSGGAECVKVSRTEIDRLIEQSPAIPKSVLFGYEQKFAGGKLETGIKISNVKTSNDFQRYDVQKIADDTKTLDTSRSNQFIYKEQINAGYVSFNKQYKGVMFQIGLRIENSNVTGNTIAQKNDGSGWKNYDTTFERKYTDFFPSASLSFNKNPMNQWSLSYSRRIDRPAYQQLNPFEFKLDEYTYQKGNTNLTPQYTNIFSVSNTYKYTLTTSLSYSHIKDMFAQIIDTTEKSKSYMTNKNLATQDIFNLSISYPFQKGIYNAYFSLNAFYSKYQAENVGGANRNISLEVTSANLYMQHSFNLGKGYKSEISSWLSTPSIQEGTFESKAMGFVDLGLSKQIMQGKGNIKVSVSDIFNTMRWRGTSNFVGQYLVGQFRWESQQLKLNFSYRFGKNTVKAARQRKTGVEDESNRVKGGGGFGGN